MECFDFQAQFHGIITEFLIFNFIFHPGGMIWM